MRNLLRDRRGVSAFITVIVLSPLIGVVALGAEAGSWYVTQRHAQNAADAAAYSGALRLACTIAPTTCTAETQSVDYRGKEFASQNGFRIYNPPTIDNTAYPGHIWANLPTGTTQTVKIEAGPAIGGPWTDASVTAPPASDSFVRATVTQTQPPYLLRVFGRTSNVTIPAIAIAQVEAPINICGLGLARFPPNSGAAVTVGGNVTGGAGCGLMSDDKVNLNGNPPWFPSGSGWALYGYAGCGPGSCPDPLVPYNYSMSYAYNPLQVLDTESFNSRTGNTNPCPGNTNPCSISPNSTGAYGNLSVSGSNQVTFTGGTYFFYNASISINGGTVNGTGVTLVLLGNSKLSITGGTVNLSAPTTNSISSDLNGVLIDDQAPNRANLAVNINGGSSVSLGGAMYFPNVDVTWSGGSANANTTCSEVIANTLTLTGTSYLSTGGCAPNTIPATRFVALVQ